MVDGNLDTTGIALATQPAIELNGGSIKNLTGLAPDSLNFTAPTNLESVKADGIAPTITTLSPAEDAMGVPLDANLVFTFSEEVKAADGDHFIQIIQEGLAIEVIPVRDTTRVTISGNTVTINPTKDFLPDAIYEVAMGGNTFTDLAGNPHGDISNMMYFLFSTSKEFMATYSSPTLTVTGGVAADSAVAVGADGTISLTDASTPLPSGTKLAANDTIDASTVTFGFSGNSMVEIHTSAFTSAHSVIGSSTITNKVTLGSGVTAYTGGSGMDNITIHNAGTQNIAINGGDGTVDSLTLFGGANAAALTLTDVEELTLGTGEQVVTLGTSSTGLTRVTFAEAGDTLKLESTDLAAITSLVGDATGVGVLELTDSGWTTLNADLAITGKIAELKTQTQGNTLQMTATQAAQFAKLTGGAASELYIAGGTGDVTLTGTSATGFTTLSAEGTAGTKLGAVSIAADNTTLDIIVKNAASAVVGGSKVCQMDLANITGTTTITAADTGHERELSVNVAGTLGEITTSDSIDNIGTLELYSVSGSAEIASLALGTQQTSLTLRANTADDSLTITGAISGTALTGITVNTASAGKVILETALGSNVGFTGAEGHESIVLATGYSGSASMGDGDDTVSLSGTLGAATVAGEAGNDTLKVTGTADITAAAISGFTTVELATYTLTLNATQGTALDSITGAAGGKLDVQFGTDEVLLDLSTKNLTGFSGSMSITGSVAADTITLASAGTKDTVVVNFNSTTGSLSSDSKSDAFDTISGFVVTEDKLELVDKAVPPGVTIGVQDANIGSHTVTGGVVTFANSLSGATAKINALVTSTTDFAAGKVVGFADGDDFYVVMSDGATGTSGDVVVKLAGVTTATGISIDADGILTLS